MFSLHHREQSVKSVEKGNVALQDLTSCMKEAGELEANEWFRNYLRGKNREELYANFNEALQAVNERSVPDWDC